MFSPGERGVSRSRAPCNSAVGAMALSYAALFPGLYSYGTGKDALTVPSALQHSPWNISIVA